MDSCNQNEINIDVGLIVKKICNFKTIRNIILSGIICSVCVYSYSRFCIPERFTSQVSMYVNNSAVASAVGKVEMNDITASQKIVKSCIVILKDSIVMKEISDKLIRNYSEDDINKAFTISIDENGKKLIPASEISDCINISNINETEIMSVSVTTKSPEMSYAVCKYVVDIAPKTVKRVIDGGRIETIGEPGIPKNKAYPNNIKNSILGGFAGVLSVLTFYFLKIIFDTKFKNSDEFSNRYDIPVLSEIPFYESKDLKKSEKITRNKMAGIPSENSFFVVEAYNSLCSNILFSCRANDSKVIIISGAEIGDGKSTTAHYIAQCLNNIIGNVLLIDCDMRRPSIHKRFNYKNNKGLSSVLSGMTGLEETIIKREGLPDVITAGSNPPNAAEMLASKYMDELLEECIKRYSYIIIDTPPINLVNDACILSKYSRGIVFVARAGRTRYKDFEKAEKNLKIVGSRITSVIINAVDNEYSYYGKYYNYGYENKEKASDL